MNFLRVFQPIFIEPNGHLVTASCFHKMCGPKLKFMSPSIDVVIQTTFMYGERSQFKDFELEPGKTQVILRM